MKFLHKNVNKLISVYLGNHTNITAIRNGVPVETSIGFSPVEGILSANSCGDIDPTVIFQLYSSGISFQGINELPQQARVFLSLLLEKNKEIKKILENDV